MSTLQYYFEDGSHVIFNKYTITNGVIINNKTGNIMSYSKNKEGYNLCSVLDDSGKLRRIRVCRAIASVAYGPPPSPDHTADHIDRNKNNDTDGNIRWLCRIGQRNNQKRLDTRKSAYVIVRDGIEKTASGWMKHFKGDKNSFGRGYSEGILIKYAQKKQYGFSYKEYPDIPGELWKEIAGSKTKQGRWEISDMNRMKYITKHAVNVLSGERLCLSNGYPKIKINGQDFFCHVLSFMTFFPEEYAKKKTCEMILHEDDNRVDFRPHKLRLGTRCENNNDAHTNGCYDGAINARVKCASYINGVLEKEHESQRAAAKYLIINGHPNAVHIGICQALNGRRKSAYGRTWELC